MKKYLLIILLFISSQFSIIVAQPHSIEEIIQKVENYADSSRHSNHLIAESFAYDLLNLSYHIIMYGLDSQLTLQRFYHVCQVEYDRYMEQVKFDMIDCSSEIMLSKNEAKSIINMYRIYLSDLSIVYGDSYLNKVNSEITAQRRMVQSENWNNEYGSFEQTFLNTYNIYRYGLIEDTYNDELCLYILHNDIEQFTNFYNLILTSKISDVAKAQMALDSYDILIDYHNPVLAKNVLDMWSEYDENNGSHLNDYQERVRTKLGMLALRHHNYFLAYTYCSWVDFVVHDGGKDIWRYFEDINEFLRQLETRALIELEVEADTNLANKKALGYFEFADSLITNDVRCHNQVVATPAMCSIIYRQLIDSYVVIGDYDAAERIIRKTMDRDNGYFNLNTYLAYANLLMNMKKYTSAKEILYDCLEYLSTYKYKDESKLNVYRSLLVIEKHLGNSESLSYIAEKYFNTEKDYYHKELSLQPSYQRKNYWENEFNLQYMSANAGHLASINSKCASTGYDAALFQKGLLLRFDTIEASNVNNSGDAELVEAYRQWLDCTEKDVQDSIKYIAADKFANLYSMHPEFITDIRHLTWKDIQSVLKPGEVAIEFIETYDSSNRMIYGAYLLGLEYEMPQYLTLCKSDALKSLLKKSVSGGYYPDVYTPIAQSQVYELIWAKIEPYLDGISKIYFSPQGLLTQLNIEVLSKEDKYPLNQKYDIYRMSSTALLMDGGDDSIYSSATLMGGIDYNSNLQSFMDKGQNTVGASTSVSRGSSKEWKPLPHTSIEVEDVEKMLQKKKVVTQIYKGELASEESFKAMTYQSNSMIHIATHGFYFPSNEAQKWEYFVSDNDEREYVSPLRRSGLVLAGGNHAWLGEDIPEGVEDGIVSAHEIANMNLSDTELVVLSACQTGLGEISNEGVSGIQRAFKLAGVKTLVMSLWEVSDEATSIMMKSFYKNLTKGKSKRDSFNAAIQSVKKWNDNPYYWAAFIMLD